jgi:hypothetical protein
VAEEQVVKEAVVEAVVVCVAQLMQLAAGEH